MERNKDDGWGFGCGVSADLAAGISSLCGGRDSGVLARWISAHASRSQLSGSDDSVRRLNGLLLTGAAEIGCVCDLATLLSDATRLSKRTGESAVYQRHSDGLIVKVKDPFAKLHLKGGRLDGLLYEHQAHNLIFSNVCYRFLGIAREGANARIVLQQRFVAEGTARPVDQQVDEFFLRNGFSKKSFYYSDGFVSVTDAMGDNVLMSESRELYFIDPIIRFDKDVFVCMDHLRSKYSNGISYTVGPVVRDDDRCQSFWQRLRHLFQR